jgi:isoquinoline 1-oxidoreductase subunit beta
MPDRRQFLIKTGWISAGLTVLSSCSPIYSAIPALPSTKSPEWSDAVTWVQVLPDGKVRFYCPRMEMGQGAAVGLSQVVGEELNVGQDDIECILPDTGQIPRFKMTVGSQSIAEFFEPVSRASAKLREILRARAAENGKLDISLIKDMKGGFQLSGGRQLKYRELVDDVPVCLSDSTGSGGEYKQYSAENDRTRHAIGKNWKHHNLKAIVTGQSLYARDVSVDGMVYGHVLKPPVPGSQLVDVDVTRAKALPGVIAIVIEKKKNFVGLVVERPSQLRPAVEQVSLIWQVPDRQDQSELNDLLDVTRVRKTGDFEHELISSGKIPNTPSSSVERIEAVFETSFAAHAAMEPRSAVASVKNRSAEIWCGSQDPFFVRGRVAKAAGFSSDSVTVYPRRMGGGFGGRVPCQASEEAVLLSKAVRRPVRVAWDRESEFTQNYFQPRFSHHISAGVTKEGLIDHWQHDFVSSPIITGLIPDNIAWIVDKVVADEGTARGSLMPYQVENQLVRYSDIRTSVPIGAWRGLGSAPNSFAMESMIDELARKADRDPLAFRLGNLTAKQGRLARVLKRAAAMAKWGRELRPGAGLGIACAIYKGESFAAVVAEVDIDTANQTIQVKEIWCAQDSGLVINPDQVENQIAGNIVWGCSMVLKEQVTFEAGMAGQGNFDTYEILRHNETPLIHTELVSSKERPSAVGETAFGPVAPAITNAIFAATGQRIRKLPVDPEKFFAS